MMVNTSLSLVKAMMHFSNIPVLHILLQIQQVIKRMICRPPTIYTVSI